MSLFDETKHKLDEMGLEYEAERMDTGAAVIRQYFWIGDTGIRYDFVTAFEPEESAIYVLVLGLLTVELGTTQTQRVLEVCNDFNSRYSHVKMFMNKEGLVMIRRDVDVNAASVELLVGCIGSLYNMLDEEDYLKRLLKIRWS